MPSNNHDPQYRRDVIRATGLTVALVVAILLIAAHYLDPAPPRRIVLASGTESGMYHRHALRYGEILARDGVTLEERLSGGAVDNLRLLRDPKSGVDVAFLQAGVATSVEAAGLEMLASLYYEPLWVFYREDATITRLNQLRAKRIAVGGPGSGTRAFAAQMLEANGIAEANSQLVGAGNLDAVHALQKGDVDAAMLVGSAKSPAIALALTDPTLKLMSFERADAYTRRFPFLRRLTLPAGTIDFERNIPERDVTLIGAQAMLAARADYHPALVSLLFDAAREIHGGQGEFEAPGEFPGTARVDLPVSDDADHHRRFGPSFLHRYLPFWAATFIERTIILLIPLVVVIVPLINLLPQILRWRVRSRIFRWYGELALLERDVRTRSGAPPIERWLADLDRIERAVEGIRTPASYASEAYTLREHVGLVRRAIVAKAGSPAAH
jgi:TRAP transporter TAXI family solute receptor